MKIEELIDAFGEIDPVYVQEAENWQPGTAADERRMSEIRRKHLKRWLPVAACLCILAAGGAYGIWNMGNRWTASDMETAESASDDGTDMEAAFAGDASAEMADDAASDGASSDIAAAGADTIDDAAENAKTTDGAASDAEPEGDATTDLAAAETAVRSEEMEQADGAAESADLAETASGAAADNIFINEVDKLLTLEIDMEASDYEEWYTAEELQGYYGVQILTEELPEDLALSDAAEPIYMVGYNEDGQVTIDNNRLCYQDETAARELTVAVRTVESGSIDLFADAELEVSHIDYIEITIGHYAAGADSEAETGQDEYYRAIFEKDGVTFTVTGRNLTEEELLTVLRDLICE